MQGTSARVDGGDACGGQYDVFLAYVVADVAQEGRLARTGLPRQEERLAGVLHEVQGVLKLTVAGVGEEGLIHSPLSISEWLSLYRLRPLYR